MREYSTPDTIDMPNSNKRLRDEFKKRPLVLYGAGRAGKIALRNLKAEGVEVAAILDARALPAEQ